MSMSSDHPLTQDLGPRTPGQPPRGPPLFPQMHWLSGWSSYLTKTFLLQGPGHLLFPLPGWLFSTPLTRLPQLISAERSPP